MPPRQEPSAPAAPDPQPDPRAPLDSSRFLTAARGVLRQLEAGLLERADASPAVTGGLRARHAEEVQRRRTTDPYELWRRAWVEQVAAAWLLSAVFIRILEDRGLVQKARIAGPGAQDSQDDFWAVAPALAESDYLLTAFREMGTFSALRDVFGPRQNPAFLLSSSNDAARALLALFCTPSVEAPAFRFGHPDTRFLGDLYQDLSEDVQKRHALLQTPRFVEQFILDRTLAPAIERFGLDQVTVLDPACGSGHFLLDAFERLVDEHLRARPAEGSRAAATRAMGALAGVDINPYSAAITRMRLVLAYLEKAGIDRLEEAPPLPMAVVAADSLLHPTGEPVAPADLALDDEDAARRLLQARYAVVVANPPYITVKDPVLYERYRELYIAAAGRYSLVTPFTERFFQLARPGGYVGTIVASSFMKREFGRRLVEEVLPRVNLTLLVNTSGAYIPGYGTPTMLLFGTAEPPQHREVHVVLGRRGEPRTPEDPAQGQVWRSIAEHWAEVGFENEHIATARVERAAFNRHPWSLGAAVALKEALDSAAKRRLRDVIESIGIASVTGADDVYLAPRESLTRAGLEERYLKPMTQGGDVKDWTITPRLAALFPYNEDLSSFEAAPRCLLKYLWPFRTLLTAAPMFGGKTKTEVDARWFEYRNVAPARLKAPQRIAFAQIAPHNHFALAHGGWLFGQSAPIIHLRASVTAEEILCLLAYLNSSTACFWTKQVSLEKPLYDVLSERIAFHELTSTSLRELPLPPDIDRHALASAAGQMQRLAEARADRRGRLLHLALEAAGPLRQALDAERRHQDDLLCRMVALQEAIDVFIYDAMDLLPADLRGEGLALAQRLVEGGDRLRPEDRAFLLEQPSYALGEWLRRVIDRTDPIRTIETSEYKRGWLVWDWSHEINEAVFAWCQERIEAFLRDQRSPALLGALVRHLLGQQRAGEILALIGVAPEAKAVTQFLQQELDHVPFLAAYRYTDSGLEKRGQWERCWELQRRQDRGEPVGDIPIPPKYSREDYRDLGDYSLRGKLDVPRERFISYPGCESVRDAEPVYGWAGWDHLRQAEALADLYRRRRVEEAWTAERLTPLLAGLAELLPWVRQWHDAPGGEAAGLHPADDLEAFLEAQCRELHLTRDALRAFRPPRTERRGRRRHALALPPTEDAEEQDLFCVATSRYDVPPASSPRVILERVQWNDFGFATQFRAYYAYGAQELKLLGDIKILQRDAQKPFLPAAFKRLDARYCSLGQSLSYYEQVRALGPDVARDILSKLRDIVMDRTIAEEFAHVPGYQISLLRFPDAQKAFREAAALFDESPPVPAAPRADGDRLEFTFTCPLQGFDSPHRAQFSFWPDRQGFGRIMALVGRNGTGKTRLLAALAHVLSGLDSQPGKIEPDGLTCRVVAISFSTFDRFTRPSEQVAGNSYSYYGLRRPPAPPRLLVSGDVDHPRPKRLDAQVDLDYAFDSLARSVQRIQEQGAEQRDSFRALLDGAGVFRAEPRLEKKLAQGDVSGFLEDLKDAASGHQILAFVATALVEYVDKGTVVLFDEPELYLHPNMLSSLVRLLYEQLERRDAYAVLATHSPVVLQEIPARSIRIIRLEGRHPHIDPYQRESFGENLSEIVQHAFGVDEEDRSYVTILKALAARMDRREVEALFDGLGLGPRMLLREIYRQRGAS